MSSMAFVLIQLFPWTILTILVAQSYLQDRCVEKKHLLWAMSAMMSGFLMSLIGLLLGNWSFFPPVVVLKFFDVFHLFALYSIFLLLTDFETSKRRQVHLMSAVFIVAGLVILFDPTSRQIAGGLLTAAYDRGIFSSGVMLTAMLMWAYLGWVFHRFSLRETRLLLKRSTRYFSLACLFAVLSYASAVILYVMLKVSAGMILARTLPILAGFWIYLGARTPNLLSSLHRIAEQRQQLGEEKKRLQGLSAGTTLLGEIGDPETLLASVIDNARVHTGAAAVTLTRWHRDVRKARIAHLSIRKQEFETIGAAEEIERELRNFVLRALPENPYRKMVLQRQPLEMHSLSEVFDGQFPAAKIASLQQVYDFQNFVHYPLFVNRSYQGTLTFAFADDNFDRSLLNVYADECEQVIRLIDLLQRSRQHSHDLALTNQLMQRLHEAKLSKSYTLAHTLQSICADLQQRLEGSFVGVWQIVDGVYELSAWHMQGNGRLAVPARTYRADKAFPEARFLRDLGYMTATMQPLYNSEGRLFGQFTVAREEPLEFSPRENEIVKFYAGWVAVEIEREKQTQKLQASEQKYRGLFENALEGIYQISPRGRFLTANPALVAMLGYAHKKELFAIDVKTQLFARAEEFSALMRDLQAQGKVTGRTLRLRHKDGSERYVLASARKITDGRGQLLCYEGVFQDITRRKLLEKQLLRAQKMESIGTLASGVAHDFNNSLSAILPMAELIKLKSDRPEVVRKCIDVIIDGARHSTRLATQLLTLSKDRQLAKKPIDVRDTLASVVNLMQKSLPPGVDLAFTCADAFCIEADAAQVEQMLINLILNARDAFAGFGHNRSTRTIAISVTAAQPSSDLFVVNQRQQADAQSWLRIRVTDNGSGMDAQTLDHIFEPFYTTKEPGKGTGLGLAMVYAIVQNHDGLIDVNSKPGHGTTFDIYLPALSADAAGEVEIAPGVKRGKGHLLIVDDQKEVRESLEQILHSLGYDCTRVQSGDRALEVYDPTLHDAVILDVSMPGLSGIQTFENLKARFAAVRVLLISGFAKGNSVDRALAAGACGFIRKPFSLSQISSAVYQLIHNERTMRVEA